MFNHTSKPAVWILGGDGGWARGGGVKLVFLNFSRIIDDVIIFLENLAKYDKTYDVREYFQLYFRFFNDFLISCLKGSFSAPNLQKFSNYFISMQTFYKHKIIFHVVTSYFEENKVVTISQGTNWKFTLNQLLLYISGN